MGTRDRGANRRDFLKRSAAFALSTAISENILHAAASQPDVGAIAAYVPGSARRLSQLTGDVDPEALPHLNRTSAWGLTGTDMGCPVEFRDRLYLLFGDVPTTHPVDIDPICYTTDRSIVSGNLRLHCITGSTGSFSPLTVDGRTLGTNETVTGAFAYDNRLYAFVVRGNSRPYSTLVSTPDPAISTNFASHYDISDTHGKFWQIAPWVVRNAEVPGLPSASGDGLLMWGQSGSSVYLAWMPLTGGLHSPANIRYYAGDGRWSADQSRATPLFATNGVTQLSVTWLAGPRKWICLYTRASVEKPDESIVARIGDDPSTWSEEITLFSPTREKAWGDYMHRPGKDALHTLAPARDANMPGYAYSPFLLDRYTRWNAATHRLDLKYLMATFVPYQVMLMQAALQFTVPTQNPPKI